MAEGDTVKGEMICIVQSDGKQKSRMTFGDGATVTTIKTFMGLYSGAAIIGVNENNKLECAVVAADAGANVDMKLIVTYKNATTAEVGRFVVPAYDGGSVSLVFDDEKSGKRLSKTSGDAIVAAWKTANGITDSLVFLSGTPVQTP